MGISGSVASRFPSSEDVESAAAKYEAQDKAEAREIVTANVARVAVDNTVGELKKAIKEMTIHQGLC